MASWIPGHASRLANRRNGPIAAITTILLSFVAVAVAQNGMTDPSFGANGTVILRDPYFTETGVLDVVQDGSGRLIAAGGVAGDFTVMRLRRDGTPDSSWNENGYVSTAVGLDGQASDIALQPDGRVVAVGSGSALPRTGELAVARYTADGRLDPSFGRGGLVTARFGARRAAGRAVAIQRGGRLIVVGTKGRGPAHSTGIVIRYRPNGTLDRSFGRNGLVRFDPRARGHTDIWDVVTLGSGKILVAGVYRGRFVLARLRFNGTFDRSFGGGDGRVLTEFDRRNRCACGYAAKLAVSRDGRILLLGDLRFGAPFFALARYTERGRLDRRFGQRGLVVEDRERFFTEAYGLAIQRDGRIVLAGTLPSGTERFAVFRYRPFGKRDRSFYRDGVLVRRLGTGSSADAVIMQRDGRVVVGGRAEFGDDPEMVLMRFLTGSTD